MIVKGEPYGAIRLTYLNASRLTTEEVGLAVALADQAALAIENSQLRSQAGQLAALNERNRLARELHDSVTQSLYSLTLMAEANRRRLETGEPGPTSRGCRLRASSSSAVTVFRS